MIDLKPDLGAYILEKYGSEPLKLKLPKGTPVTTMYDKHWYFNVVTECCIIKRGEEENIMMFPPHMGTIEVFDKEPDEIIKELYEEGLLCQPRQDKAYRSKVNIGDYIVPFWLVLEQTTEDKKRLAAAIEKRLRRVQKQHKG